MMTSLYGNAFRMSDPLWLENTTHKVPINPEFVISFDQPKLSFEQTVEPRVNKDAFNAHLTSL